jgi:hypothetical protein
MHCAFIREGNLDAADTEEMIFCVHLSLSQPITSAVIHRIAHKTALCIKMYELGSDSSY